MRRGWLCSLRCQFRFLRPVYRRIACQQLTQPGYGGDGIFAQSRAGLERCAGRALFVLGRQHKGGMTQTFGR